MGAVDVAGRRQEHARGPAPTDPDDVGHGNGARWRGALAVGLTVVALAPVLVVVVTRTGRPYLPLQDLAYIDLRVRDVWSSGVPLVGPYSKGFSHPGPLLFWILAIPSKIFGGEAWATLVGAAVLQGVAIAATARLAWRRGGLPLLLLALCVVLLSYPEAPLFLHSWNPNIALPFFPLYLLLVWSVAEGERSKAVWATVVGVFLVQTHIGYALLVAVPAVWAGVVVWRESRRSPAGLRPWRRPGVQSAVVAAVLCAPLLVDQLVGTRNLRRIAGYFTRSDEHPVGLRAGARLLASEFTVPPPWLGGRVRFIELSAQVDPASLAWLLVPAGLVVLAVVVGRRSTWRSDRRLVQLAALGCLTGLVAMSQLRRPLEPYLFFWRGQLAALLVLGVAWLVLRSPPVARSRVAWRLAGAVALVLVVGRGLTLAQDVTTYEVGRVLPFEPTAQALVDQIGDDVPTRPVLVRGRGLAGLPEAVVDELDRRGAPMRLDEELEFKWGEHRVASPESVSTVWYVVEQGVMVSLLTDLESARVLARLTPLDASAEREAIELQRRLARQLRRTGREERLGLLDSSLVEFALREEPGLDRAALARLARLNERVERSDRCRCAIVATPPDEPALEGLPIVG